MGAIIRCAHLLFSHLTSDMNAPLTSRVLRVATTHQLQENRLRHTHIHTERHTSTSSESCLCKHMLPQLAEVQGEGAEREGTNSEVGLFMQSVGKKHKQETHIHTRIHIHIHTHRDAVICCVKVSVTAIVTAIVTATVIVAVKCECLINRDKT